jgi:hypothetical protein
MPLNYGWKLVGIVLVLAAMLISILYFGFDFRISLPVLAISSYFMEHKMFTSFTTNVADEILLLLYIIGLAMIVLSKEKIETNETQQIKYQSLVRALIVNTILQVISILFVFGGSFVSVMIFNLISIWVIYLLIFYKTKRVLK